jgi:ribonuclease P protein component
MNEYAKRYVCIKKDREFKFLFRKGNSVVTDAFVCYARESKRRVNRIGIVTGKKVGNAVKRSRARRVIREAFRLIDPLLREKTQKRYDFIFVARAKTPAMKSTQVYRQMENKLLKRYAVQENKAPAEIQKIK